MWIKMHFKYKFKDINLVRMIKQHPLNIFFRFPSGSGFFYRKSDYYTQLRPEKYITNFNIDEIVLLQKDPNDTREFWQKHLYIDSSWGQLWSAHRYIFLEKFFLK